MRISPEFIAAIEQYDTPNRDVIQSLGNKVIVPVIGPTAVGKSSIMDMACDHNSDFYRARSFTTRPQRPNEADDTYRFLPHNQHTIDELQQKMQQKTLVQIIQHPATGYIYGSEIQDYPAAYNLIDMLPKEMPKIRQLPFGYCLSVAVSTHWPAWHAWFLERHQQNPNLDDSRARLQEAYENLTWSLDDAHTSWLKNERGRLETAARNLVNMARGELSSDPVARILGKEMLESIAKLSASLTAANGDSK